MFPCIKCGEEVRPRQQAVSCDECGLWQHRKCDTGITFAQYQDARKGTISLTFICVPCSDGSRNSNLAAALLEEERSTHRETDTCNSEEWSMETADNDTREMASNDDVEIPSEEEEVMDTNSHMEEVVHVSANDDRNEIDDSFDVGHRNIASTSEVLENSLDDEDLPDTITSDEEVSYEVLPTGSKRGAPLLISSDGFSYGIKTKKQSKVLWRCSVRTKTNPCLVTVAQDGDRFIVNQHKHSHPADPKLKVKKKVYVKVKETARQQVFKPTTEIVEEALRDTVTDENVFLKQKNSTVKRVVNKFRAKTRPDTPKDLNFEINTDFLNMDDFLVADIRMDCARHIVFSTPFQLNLIRQARRWFIDGTFKIVGAPFQTNGQLMSINAFVQKDGQRKQFPLLFAHMSKRRKCDYVAALCATLDKIDQPLVESFVLDFEAGAWQAIREVFPGKSIKGCVFHWSQAVYRRVQNLGLATSYREQGPMHNYIRQLLALPFLPADHIQDTFQNLKIKANNDELKKLVDYTCIETQWFENPVFEVSSWSVFRHTVRTNNDLEAWHRRLNCRGTALSFYKLVPVLIKEAEIVKMNVQAADLETRVRETTSKISKKLEKAWAAYSENEMTTSRFLKTCAKIYKM